VTVKKRCGLARFAEEGGGSSRAGRARAAAMYTVTRNWRRALATSWRLVPTRSRASPANGWGRVEGFDGNGGRRSPRERTGTIQNETEIEKEKKRRRRRRRKKKKEKSIARNKTKVKRDGNFLFCFFDRLFAHLAAELLGGQENESRLHNGARQRRQGNKNSTRKTAVVPCAAPRSRSACSQTASRSHTRTKPLHTNPDGNDNGCW
jgi:hypothetical protein